MDYNSAGLIITEGTAPRPMAWIMPAFLGYTVLSR